MRTVVTFKTDKFNTSTPREHFINPCCYGDDLCKWLIAGLSEAGFVCGEPGQEDFGWFFNLATGDVQYCFVCGARPEDQYGPAVWIGWVEQTTGFGASLTATGNKGVALSAPLAIHDLLTASPEVSEIRWHEKYDFDAGDEESAADKPE